MRYVKLISGVLIAAIAYCIMFIQFLFYSDESIGPGKLITREFISLIFLFVGLYWVLANKTGVDKKGDRKHK